MSLGEPHTRLSSIKQDLLDFKNEINSVLVNIKTEMQSEFDDINNRLNMIENNVKSSTNNQINESVSNMKHYHKCFNPAKDRPFWGCLQMGGGKMGGKKGPPP